jgi:hypothetical protein
MIPESEAAAFWARVSKREGDCWFWNLAIDTEGYGRWGNRRAHRVAYEIEHGSLDRELTIDHRCGNRSCVNPEHLEAVSIQVNLARRGSVKTTPYPSRKRSPERYARRRERGVCVQCNTPSEKYRCDRCGAAHNAKMKARRKVTK